MGDGKKVASGIKRLGEERAHTRNRKERWEMKGNVAARGQRGHCMRPTIAARPASALPKQNKVRHCEALCRTVPLFLCLPTVDLMLVKHVIL